MLVRVLSDFIPQLKCVYEYKQAFASTYNSDRDLEGSEVVEVAILYFRWMVFMSSRRIDRQVVRP